MFNVVVDFRPVSQFRSNVRETPTSRAARTWQIVRTKPVAKFLRRRRNWKTRQKFGGIQAAATSKLIVCLIVLDVGQIRLLTGLLNLSLIVCVRICSARNGRYDTALQPRSENLFVCMEKVN